MMMVPRMTSLQNIDFPKNLKSEFPYRKNNRGRIVEKNSVVSGDFPETINEDILEDDAPVYVRHSRFQEMRDYNEFGPRQKRYRSDEGGRKRRS